MAKTKRTLIKLSNPEAGITQEEYEAICKALGVEPDPEEGAKAPEDPAEVGPGPK